MNSRIDPAILAIAMAAPDDNLAPPSRVQTSSLVNRLAALTVGEVCYQGRQVDASLTLAQFAAEGVRMREQLRSSINSSVRVARDRHPGREFDIEVADLSTSKRQFHILAIITRAA